MKRLNSLSQFTKSDDRVTLIGKCAAKFKQHCFSDITTAQHAIFTKTD